VSEPRHVVVIGGGPGGYGAALAARAKGAQVTIIEAERPGGQCVNHACIPTGAMLSAAVPFLEGQELSVMGVIDLGDQLSFSRAVARKDALVARMVEGIAASLRMAKVQTIIGNAVFADESTVIVTAEGTERRLIADSFIIATGADWIVPELPGLPAGRVVTADVIHATPSAPETALVLGAGPAQTAFGVEYAVLLAASGTSVTLAVPGPHVVPGLDADLDPLVDQALSALGIRLMTSAQVVGGNSDGVVLRHADGESEVAAASIVAADARSPAIDAASPSRAGVICDDGVVVDRTCRTNVAHIFAVGDVTGGAMVTAAASHMGEVAGANAADGGQRRTRLGRLPHSLHTVPEIAWIGATEADAAGLVENLGSATIDLGWSARSITLGGREGALKLVVDLDLGEILGAHAVGPGASEIIAVCTAAMQAELTVEDVAAQLHWHPSHAESVREVAQRLIDRR